MSANWEVPGPDGTRFSSIRHVARTGSTNIDLLTLAAGGAASGLVLVADRQDAGRGRQARQWHSEPGNSALFSVLLRPPTEVATLIPLLKGLAVLEAIDRLLGREAEESLVALKWPNDVLVPSRGERKLAGILAEATTERDGLAVVVGTGINLRFESPPPAEVADRAVTLEELTGGAVDRNEVVRSVLVALESQL
ncbi:MAG: biotin--[acetyl-CoA-carboxylase] ligase, partial [Actinomycetota bacterium]